MLSDVALPIASPNGITVALAPVKVSDNIVPPCSNSIRPRPVVLLDSIVTPDSCSSNMFPKFCSNSIKPGLTNHID